MVANVRIIHLEFVFIYIFKQRIQFYSVSSKWYGFFGREERGGGGGGGVGGAKDVPMARSLPPINPIRVEGGKGGGGGGCTLKQHQHFICSNAYTRTKSNTFLNLFSVI